MSSAQGGGSAPRIASGLWTRAKTQSKVGFDKLWATADKLGDPVNKLSNKIGSEAFWPTTIDKESEKAARILKSFCKDGFYQEEVHKTVNGPQQKQKVLKRIPASVIQNAKGLAIFTTMRTGLWVSGAGGSGVLVGRKEDGNWSQPVGIMLHTAGLGFLVGVDIYDCVLVINTPEALAAFSRWRCTVGGEISAVAGPAGVGGMLETEVHKRQAAVFTYLKSRGFYAGVQIDGTVVIERTDENEHFYGERISAKDILAGKAQSREFELRVLMATLKSAEGDSRVDRSLLPSEPPPADMQVTADGQIFGVPDREDPDPYGVHALEKEGLVVREAGTHAPVSVEQFDFHPSITSPVYDTFRRSDETSSRRGSWRSSTLSSSTMAERDRERQREREKPRYVTSDSATQTDFPAVTFPSPASGKKGSPEINSASPTRSARSPLSNGVAVQTVPEEKADAIETKEAATVPENVAKQLEPTTAGQEQAPEAIVIKDDEPKPTDVPTSSSEDDEEEPEVHEAPVVHQVSQAIRPQVVNRAQVTTVAVPKRGPPPLLPPRHPARKRSFGTDGSPHPDSDTPDSASLASFRSSGKPASTRSSRADSLRDGIISHSASTVQSPVPTPADEKPNPAESTSAGQAEEVPTPQTATPVKAFTFGPQSLRPLRSTSPHTASKSVSPPARIRPNMAATLRQNSSDSIPTKPRQPNVSAPPTQRQNSGSGAVSALKSRFENKPPPINTQGSRPPSSRSNEVRAMSPVKQLAGYTTTADEVKAGRISPGAKPEDPETLPGAFPVDSLDGTSDTPATARPQPNGVEATPRVGRTPFKFPPNQESLPLPNGTHEPAHEQDESPVSPLRSPMKGPSLVAMRGRLNDDDSDVSRSRSASPLKVRPISVDVEPDEDFA